jgi:hypothetical protein
MADSGEATEASWDTPAKVAALRAALQARRDNGGKPIGKGEESLPVDIVTGWPAPRDGLDPIAAYGLHGPCGDDETLKRFLRARKGDIDASSKMLLRHVQWRHEEVKEWPSSAVPPSEIEIPLRGGASYIRGFDKQGRPTAIVRVKFHVASTERSVLHRYVIHMLDEMVARSLRASPNTGVPSHQFSVILDADGLGWSSFDADILKFILKMLSGNYPERLGLLYILNDGFMFRMLWKVIEPFLDSRTSKKIRFLGGPASYKPALLEAWTVDQLPTVYGGTDTFEYDPEKVISPPSLHISVSDSLLPRADVHMAAHGHHKGPHPAHGHHHSEGSHAGAGVD